MNIYVHRFCPSSRDLTVPDKPDPPGSSRRRVLFEKLSIFLKQTTNNPLTWGFQSCFSLPISSLRRATALLKQFPFSLTTTSFLWGGIFSDAGNRLLKMVPSMNKSFTLPSYQHYFNPFLMKQRLKSADLSPKPFFFGRRNNLSPYTCPGDPRKKTLTLHFDQSRDA